MSLRLEHDGDGVEFYGGDSINAFLYISGHFSDSSVTIALSLQEVMAFKSDLNKLIAGTIRRQQAVYESVIKEFEGQDCTL